MSVNAGLTGVLCGFVPPDKVISAEYNFPALEDKERKEMQATRLVNSKATQGTPALFVRPRIAGALPDRPMYSIVRDATYRELLPAEITDITIKPLIR